MKITYLLTQSLDSPSGLGRYWPLARELVKLGNEIEIVALHPNFDDLDQQQYVSDGVQVKYISQMHVRKSGSQKSYFSTTRLAGIVTRATWKMTREILKTNSKIIHIGKPHPMNSISGLAGKYLKRTNLILDCDDYESASGHFQSRWQQEGIAFFERNMPKKVKAVTTNTFFMRDKLHSWEIPDAKIFYIPNGVDRERFSNCNSQNTDPIREQYKLHDKEVITYIGSLSLASHAVDLLIDCFPKVKQARPNAVLMIVGGGEDYQKLLDYAERTGYGTDIHFTGRVAPHDVGRYYALSSVSVDPVMDDDASRGRCPLKLFESWACSIPFITGNVGDRKQLIGEPPAGTLVKPGDPDSLSNAIIQVLSDKDLAYQISSQGRLRVENYYWDTLAPRMDAIYQFALSGILPELKLKGGV